MHRETQKFSIQVRIGSYRLSVRFKEKREQRFNEGLHERVPNDSWEPVRVALGGTKPSKPGTRTKFANSRRTVRSQDCTRGTLLLGALAGVVRDPGIRGDP